MVIKGGARGRAAELAAHLLRTDHNESVNVLDMWGIGAPDLTTALKEMDALGVGARTKRTLYHANIDPRINEQFTEREKKIAVFRLGKELGLEGQPFVVVEHVKNGRGHLHAVWSRIDLETMTGIQDGHNYRKHEEVARGLERDFGHQHTQGAHVRQKDTVPRPDRAPTFEDYQVNERAGRTPQEAKKIVTECWKVTTTGNDFRHRLEAEGFAVARGDRRDFVLIDQAGEIHGLTRRLDKVKAAEVRERMADVNLDELPDVARARVQLRQRQKAQEIEAAKEFTSAAERLRAEELKREAEAKGRNGPKLSNADQQIADALWQLNKTMRGQMEGVIQGKPTHDERQQHRADLGARPEMDAERVRYESRSEDPADKKPAQDPTQEKKQTREATAGGQQRDQARPAHGPIQPIMTPEPSRIEKPEPSLWQRVTGWVRGTGQQRHEARERDSGGTDLPGTRPEATQRPSTEVEKRPEEAKRPSMALFVRIFGALVDAYQQALDRAIAERDKTEQMKRAEALRHEAELRRQVEQHERDRASRAQPQTQPTPQPQQTKRPRTSPAASRVKPMKAPPADDLYDAAVRRRQNKTEAQKDAERAADRLRDEEERRRRERENTLGGSDPRY